MMVDAPSSGKAYPNLAQGYHLRRRIRHANLLGRGRASLSLLLPVSRRRISEEPNGPSDATPSLHPGSDQLDGSPARAVNRCDVPNCLTKWRCAELCESYLHADACAMDGVRG